MKPSTLGMTIRVTADRDTNLNWRPSDEALPASLQYAPMLDYYHSLAQRMPGVDFLLLLHREVVNKDLPLDTALTAAFFAGGL